MLIASSKGPVENGWYTKLIKVSTKAKFSDVMQVSNVMQLERSYAIKAMLCKYYVTLIL